MADDGWSVGMIIGVAICNSGKNFKQVAREAGFKPYTLLSEIKCERAKLPYDKVADLAAAIGICPQRLLRRCLEEYEPEAWKAMQELLPGVNA